MTRVRQERHECNTSATLAAGVRLKCYTNDTSPTRTTQVGHEGKILILITTLVKTYFYTLLCTLWQVKDYMERNNFILGTMFWKYLVKDLIQTAGSLECCD